MPGVAQEWGGANAYTRAMRELPLIDPESSDANARYEALLPI
jgi:hypothetical protein